MNNNRFTKKTIGISHFEKKWWKNEGKEYNNLKSFFPILQSKYWVQIFYTHQWMDRDCLQAIGWPCLTFFDCLNLQFACRDKIGTGQNRPFYPCFGPHGGSWSGKNWFGMLHQVVRYVTQPLQRYPTQQQKRWHFYNGWESAFLGRTPMRGINLCFISSGSLSLFLVAHSRLYKRLFPFFGPSVRP